MEDVIDKYLGRLLHLYVDLVSSIQNLLMEGLNSKGRDKVIHRLKYDKSEANNSGSCGY